MDDLKLYARSDRELNSLVNTVKIFSDDIGMSFGMDKCKIVSVKKGKMIDVDSIELPGGEKMSQIENEGYKYLGMIQDSQIRTGEMKEKLDKEYKRRVRKLAKSRLFAGNLISAINQWALGGIRYSAGIVDWTMGDLKRMDIATRKILKCNGCLHPRANISRLYIKRKDGGKGLISVEQCVIAECNSLFEYVNNSEEPMLKNVLDEGFLIANEGKKEYNQRFKSEKQHEWKDKTLHGKFPSSIKEISATNTWLWLQSGWLKKNTEAVIMAAQDQALRTNWIKSCIDGQDISPLCRVCNKADESAAHIASGCEELAKRRYKIRHDLVATRIHWELCHKYDIEVKGKWYEHAPPESVESEDGVEIMWDKVINTTEKVLHNRPDIVVVTKNPRKWTIIDIACPQDHIVDQKENEKIGRYTDLAGKVSVEFQVQTEIVPIVIGALGTLPKRLPIFIKRLGIPDITGSAQISVITSTARILRDVLSL